MPKNLPKPFLGTTTDINNAFPGIEEIDITISQDPYGYYCQDKWQRVSRFTKSTLPNHAKCANPRCQQGGIDLQSFILSHSSGEFAISCDGHEGTTTGRRRGDPCDNHFKVKLTIQRTK